jgi:ubiquinone/menaquinone biosynthesis C-methylase UbiE
VVNSILDIPSGGGRLSSFFAEKCKLLVEADISLGQVQYGMTHCKFKTPQVWLRASSFKVPLADKSVDGVVCIRLCHHLYSLDEVEKLIAEMLRVAQSFVIMSFSNANSLKNIYRRIRGIPIPNRFAKGEIPRLAERYGARLVSCPAMAPLRSHCYALMEKI